jgi:hypothetical protein
MIALVIQERLLAVQNGWDIYICILDKFRSFTPGFDE